MINVCYRIISEKKKKDKTYTTYFDGYEALENWLFGMMEVDYTKKENNANPMYFPEPESPHGSIQVSPRGENGKVFLILMITDKDGGILYSDGSKTCGHHHQSKSCKEWLKHCRERMENPTFNFVD